MLSPALGGIVIGQEVGRALGIRAIFAERQEGMLTLRRGFTLSAADRVLVVEDVITTGGSTRETSAVAARPARTWSAPPRSSIAAAIPTRLNLPLFALVKMEVPAYQPESCPLCARKSPSRNRGPGADQGEIMLDRPALSDRCTQANRSVITMRTLKIVLQYRRHRVRRLAAAGQRRLDPGAARGRARAD